jgi:hypothetical protein
LERTPGSNTGILTWKVDFSPCGLVVDQVSIKVESRNLNGGDVLVMLASGNTKKTISHMEGKSTVVVEHYDKRFPPCFLETIKKMFLRNIFL